MKPVTEISAENSRERQYYIDNLRCLCILLLVPFHAAMAWNCWGEGNYIWFSDSKVLGSLVVAVSPWYMSLLFLLAGISLFYSLRKRTAGQVVQERLQKLALPFAVGLLTVVPAMCYYADVFQRGYSGSFLEHYKVFFTRFTTLTGYDGGFTPGHLWFLLYLFVISLLCLGVISLQKRLAARTACGGAPWFDRLSARAQTLLIYAVGILPALMTPVLNISGKSIGSYIALFLIGYYVFTNEKAVALTAKLRWINLAAFLVFNALDVYMFIWGDGGSAAINTLAMHLTCWLGILTLLGMGKAYLSRQNRLTRYMTSRSFVFYIFHFIWVILFQFYLSRLTSSTLLLFAGSVVGGYIVTLLATEVIIRIPVVNNLFGVKGRGKATSAK